MVPRTGMPKSFPASVFEVAAAPPMYAARDADSAPSTPWARRSPNSMTAAAVGRQADAGALGGDEGLEVEDGKQRALDELRLDERGVHAHQRLARETPGCLPASPRHRREAKARQVVQEILAETSQALQVAPGLPRRMRASRSGPAPTGGRRRWRSRRRMAGGGRTCRRPPGDSRCAGSSPASSTARSNRPAG